MPQNTILTQELSLATMYDKVGGIPSSLPFVSFFPSPLNYRTTLHSLNAWSQAGTRGGGATSLQEATDGDVPLDGVAFSRLDGL